MLNAVKHPCGHSVKAISRKSIVKSKSWKKGSNYVHTSLPCYQNKEDFHWLSIWFIQSENDIESYNTVSLK
jgi:hypothetical protein